MCWEWDLTLTYVKQCIVDSVMDILVCFDCALEGMRGYQTVRMEVV